MPEPVRIAVFLKAPRTGSVKTRLAAELGAAEALALYRLLAERVIEAARATGWPVAVWFDPPDARRELEAWLGEGLDWRPQRGRDLGERMGAAFADLAEGEALLLVGGDIPGLGHGILRAAAHALGQADVVLGPAADGGYYLIGGRSPMPDLFAGIPWSTDRVLARTRERLRALGTGWLELPVLRDVDTGADARAAGLIPRPSVR